MFDNSQGKEIYTNHLYSDASLQGYWRFENNLNDSSSRGYNLTHAGTPAYATGQFGYGLDAEVSTANQYAYIADASCPNLEIAGNQTWSAWIKLETGDRTNLIMSKLGANGTKQLYVNSSNKLVFQLAGLGSNTTVTGNITLATGVWYNVVGRYNSSNLQVFVNGVLDNTVVSTGSAADSNGDFRVCSNTTSSGFDGIIDDVAIWNRALTDAEVLGLYTGGQDLRFSSDASGSTQLAHEVVNWDIVNDKAEVWVKIPTLSYTSDTELYVWYDNDTATPQARNDTYGSNNVWSNSFVAVYHKNNLNDSTSNQYTLSTGGNAPSDTSDGKIDGAKSYASASSQYLRNQSIPNFGKTAAFSLGAWIKGTSAWGRGILSKQDGSTRNFEMSVVNNSGYKVFFSNAVSTSDMYGTTNLSLDTWYLIYVTHQNTGFLSGENKIYVNGSLDATDTSGILNNGQPTSQFVVGAMSTGGTNVNNYQNGIIDEVRIESAVRSAGWIATEYNNQNSPATFATESADTNSERSAKIHGKLTTTNERNAKISGKDTSSSDRNAKIHGKSTTSDIRSAKITGKPAEEYANDSRGAKIRGIATIYDSRQAKIRGKLTITNDRNARISGRLIATNERNARIHGISTISDTRPAKIHGSAIGVNTRQAKIHGSAIGVNTRQAKIHGSAVGVDSRPAKIHGYSTTNDLRAAKIRGGIISTSEKSAVIHGSLSVVDNRNAKIHGFESISNERSAKIHGLINTFDIKQAKIRGGLFVSDIRNAKISGIMIASNERGARIGGSWTLYSEDIPVSLQGVDKPTVGIDDNISSMSSRDDMPSGFILDDDETIYYNDDRPSL